jgi:rubrerythrin
LGATDNAYAKVVIQDIINEENTHAGQFLELLMKLQPDEEAIYA